MFTIILVDYENVMMGGLSGYEKLSTDDKFFIFFSGLNLNIELDFLCKCKNEIKYFKVPQGSESVDKHMLAYLGYLIGVNNENAEYLILSKDKGFDNIISFLKEQTKTNISRSECIANYLNNSKQKKSDKKDASKAMKTKKVRKQKYLYTDIEKVMRNKFDDPEIDQMVQIILKHYEKETFKRLIDRDFRKAFGEKRAKELYSKIRGTL